MEQNNDTNYKINKNKIGHSSRSSSIQRIKTNLAFHLLKKDGQKTNKQTDKKEKEKQKKQQRHTDMSRNHFRKQACKKNSCFF